MLPSGAIEHVIRLGEFRRRIARPHPACRASSAICPAGRTSARCGPCPSTRETSRARCGVADRASATQMLPWLDRHPCRAATGSVPRRSSHDLAVRIELHHRIDVRSDARVGAAAIAGPDVLAVDIDVHGAHRSPLAVVRQRATVANRLVRIRQVVDRRRPWRARAAPTIRAAAGRRLWRRCRLLSRDGGGEQDNEWQSGVAQLRHVRASRGPRDADFASWGVVAQLTPAARRSSRRRGLVVESTAIRAATIPGSGAGPGCAQ